MVLVIDNYDSFVYNLVQYIGTVTSNLQVVRNRDLTVDECLGLSPSHIVLSPGPKRPEDAGILVDLIRAVPERTPILGICLGHQAIGAAFGGRVVRGTEPVHGKTSAIYHDGSGLHQHVPSPFTATRYHSLILDRKTLPRELTVTAETKDGVIMGVEHESRPIYGLQYHPESLLTEHGHEIVRNFLRIRT